MEMNRRAFLRTSAMAVATAVVHNRLASAGDTTTAVEGSAAVLPGMEWHKAPCRFCGTGCHVEVATLTTRDKKVVAIAGDAKAEVNKGLLCVKGYHVGSILYGADRLTRPQLRKNGKLESISWEEAIDIISKRINADPKKFAFYGSGQWTIPEGFAANKLMKGGLSNNHIDPNARLCMASAVTGYLSTYGVDEPAGCYDDLDKANVVICWGNNPAEMHPVLFSRFMDRRSRGEKITLIDITTRRTRTSAQSDHVLIFKPQSDLAIANGIAHLLLKNETYDKDFIAKYCNFRKDTTEASLNGQPSTIEEYRELLKDYTPEYVEKISGVPADKIRMLAEMFGDRKLLITSLWCMGMNQHTRGTAINRLVHGIHLLSGHFGKPGDAPTSLTGQTSACGTVREVGTLCHALPGGLLVADPHGRELAEGHWNLPAGRINPKPGHHAVKMWEQFCKPTKDGGDISTIWVQVTNPGQTLPNLHKLFQSKKNLEDKFLIVSDVYPTATTELADLVLPSALWVEKNGMVGNSERRTQQWFKMVNPPGEARDDTWQTIAVAHRLLELGHEGMKDKDGKFIFYTADDKNVEVPIWEWPHYYDVNVDKRLFEEYRPFSVHKHKNLAPYEEYVKARGLRWPVVQQKDGSWRETRYRFSEFDDQNVTPGKGIQFYHSVTKDDKALIWFMPYENPPEMPDAEYPYWLCTGRVLEHWHSGSMTMRVPQLRGSMPNAYVELHRNDAAKLGVQNGEIVLVRTRRGKLKLPAWIDGRASVVEGSLFIPFFDERLLVNELTLDAHDPISKQPDYKKCAAVVERLV